MDSDEEIIMPTCKILSRQSSRETRLSPIHLSDESSDSDSDSYETTPKIVEFQKKPENSVTTPPCSRRSSVALSFDKKKFADELQNKLNMANLVMKKCPGKTPPPPPPRKQSIQPENVYVLNDYSKIEPNDNDTDVQGVDEKLSGETPPREQIIRPDNMFMNELQTKLKVYRKSEPNESTDVQGVEEKLSGETRENLGGIRKKIENEVDDVDPYIYIKEMEVHVKTEEEVDYTGVGTLKAISLKKKEKPVEEDETRVGGPSKSEEMATVRPKSPRPNVPKVEKDESIWDKLGTLGRKKRIKEVQEVQAEGKYAIDSPGHPTAPIIPPEEYNLDDNEERMIIDRQSYEDSKFQSLVNVLIEWINDELAAQRIIVQDLADDLYDGQVLQKLLEVLAGGKLDVPEVTQSEEGQKQKLRVVLRHFNSVLGIQKLGHNKWNVEAIHSKNIVAIIHLLVALARHFRPPVRLTENVTVTVTIVKKQGGVLTHKVVKEKLTSSYEDVGMRCERDAFDTLFDHAPEKLQVVKKSLVTFVNKHLNKMNFEVSEIETQFHDGVYLIMLMGLLEGFFVPHYSFHLTPHEFDQKVHNVTFAFELMEEVGLMKPKARPEDIVNQDLKSTLRVLYNLFLKYKVVA